MARGLTPDKRLEITLSACARKHALDDTLPADAVDELRLLARGRSDLLARCAGQVIGDYLVHPGTRHPRELRAAALLVEAGADPRLVTQHADATRRYVAGGHHTTEQLGGAPNGEG